MRKDWLECKHDFKVRVCRTPKGKRLPFGAIRISKCIKCDVVMFVVNGQEIIAVDPKTRIPYTYTEC